MSREKSPHWSFALILSAILAALTLYPTLWIFESMWDNMQQHLHVKVGRNLHQAAMDHFVQTSGRIPSYCMNFVDTLPWYFGRTGYQIIRISIYLLTLASFGWLIGKVSGNRFLGLLAGGGFLLVMQNHVNFDTLNCFVLSLHLPLIALCLSIYSFWRYFEHATNKWLCLGALSFIISCCFYELFLPFLPVVILCGYFAANKPLSSLFKFKDSSALYKAVATLFLLSLLYLGVYIILGKSVEKEYVGSKVEGFDLGAIWQVYQSYTLSGLPTAHFWQNDSGIDAEVLKMAGNDPASFGFNWSTIKEGFSFLAIGRLLLAIALAFLILPKLSKLSSNALLSLLILSLSLILLPNILVSLTSGHQSYQQEMGYLAHNSTFYCAVGWWLLICLLLSQLAKTFTNKITLTATALLFAATSLLTDAWNQPVHRYEQHFSSKWLDMDQFLESDLYKNLPAGSKIYAPSLYQPRSYWEGEMYKYHEYWSYYAGGEVFSNEDPPPKDMVRFIRHADEFEKSFQENGGENHYHLRYLQEKDPQSEKDISKKGRALSLAPVTNFTGYRGASEIESEETQMVVFTKNSANDANWIEEGSANLPKEVLAPIWSEEFHPEEEITVPARYGGKFGDGVIQGRWCWSGEGSTLKVLNNTGKPVQALLSLYCFALDNPRLYLSFGNYVSPTYPAHRLEKKGWLLKPGINVLRIDTESYSTQQENGRWVNFALGDLKLEFPPTE